MRRLSGLVAAILLFVADAQGRIGEKEKQVEARYGAPLTVLASHEKEAGVTKCYSHRGYLIAVTYLTGRSVREMVTKVNNSRLTEKEIYALLDANGHVWNELVVAGPAQVVDGVQQWRSGDDASRVAIYDSQTRALFITTQYFIDITNAKKRQLTIRDTKRELFGPSGRMRNVDVYGNSSTSTLGGFGNQQQGQGKPPK